MISIIFQLSYTSIALIISVFTAIYYLLSRNFNYWSSRGINGPKPYIIFGTNVELLFKSLQELQEERAIKYGKIYGTYLGSEPSLMIGDPQLIKQIAIKDFLSFVNRFEFITGDPTVDRNMFNIMGDEWKNLRSIVRTDISCYPNKYNPNVCPILYSKISPTFSSGKMLKMYPLIVECVQRLESNLDKTIEKTNELEINKFTSKLLLDVIACCAFGTKIDTYSEKDTEFVVNAQKALRKTWRLWMSFFLVTLSFISPNFIKLIKFSFVEPSVVSYFKSIIRSIISRRESEKGKYYDYIQLMINACDRADKDQEDINSDKQNFKNNKSMVKLSEEDIFYTSFIFIAAGYENTSISLSNLIYSLATNQKCQQKLYEEIEKFGPDFRYEDIIEMPYLEACVSEVLRLHNTIANTSRFASEDYKLGETGIIIPKGMIVNFDIQAIHHSPEYYEEPKKFNPDRFMPENRHKLTPYTYMPFGIGPRNCVAMRFAEMVLKTAAVHLIYRYRFFKTSNTQKELKPKKFEFILSVGEIQIGIVSRK